VWEGRGKFHQSIEQTGVAIRLYTYFWKVSSLNLSQITGYPEIFSCFYLVTPRIYHDNTLKDAMDIPS
jgi:hypothetical protein